MRITLLSYKDVGLYIQYWWKYECLKFALCSDRRGPAHLNMIEMAAPSYYIIWLSFAFCFFNLPPKRRRVRLLFLYFSNLAALSVFVSVRNRRIRRILFLSSHSSKII